MRLSFPDPDWLKNLINQDPGAIEHEIIDSEIILSAPTEKLQAFWLKHLKTEGVFDDFSNMRRRNPDSPLRVSADQAIRIVRRLAIFTQLIRAKCHA